MSRSVAARRLNALALALAFAAVDLVQKASAPDAVRHARSTGAFVLMVGVFVALLVFVPLVPWRPVVAGAGVAAGGALGNLVSMLVWGGAVPDPLVVPGWVAFNLADVWVLAGDALLLAGAAVYTLRNRARLRLPV